MRWGWFSLVVLLALAAPGPAWSQTTTYELAGGYVIDLPSDYGQTRQLVIPLPGRSRPLLSHFGPGLESWLSMSVDIEFDRAFSVLSTAPDEVLILVARTVLGNFDFQGQRLGEPEGPPARFVVTRYPNGDILVDTMFVATSSPAGRGFLLIARPEESITATYFLKPGTESGASLLATLGSIRPGG